MHTVSHQYIRATAQNQIYNYRGISHAEMVSVGAEWAIEGCSWLRRIIMIIAWQGKGGDTTMVPPASPEIVLACTACGNHP